MTDFVPEPVRRFIEAHLPSVAHLEALLLLRQDPAKAWTPAELAARLYVPPDQGARVLAQLERDGFLQASGAGWSYGPAAPGLDEELAALAELYRTHLVPITRLIHARMASPGIQQFADAFLFRKEP